MYISSVWTSITSATGEANTASNVGSGTGVFKQKSALDLQFKSLTATSSKIALANNTNDVGIDVTEANLTLSNMIGPLSVAKGGTGAATLTGILKGSGTSAITAVTAPSGAVVGDTDTQSLTNKTLDSKLNTLSNVVGVHPSIKRTGAYLGNGSGVAAGVGSVGLLDNIGVTIAVATGGFGSVVRSSGGFGLRGVWNSSTTINSLGGLRFNPASLFFERSISPLIECRMAGRTASTTERIFFGFTSSTAAPTSLASPLDSLSGVAFFYDSAVNNQWHIHQNDGSATADITTIATVGTIDTSPHTFALKAVTDTKFQYSYDGGAFTDITTKIPASTTGLGFQWYVESLAGSAARALDVYWAYCECGGGP